MTRRCPSCAAEIPEDAVWVCPTCGYTLRTPGIAKLGIVFMFLGLALVGAYVMGPSSIGLTSGLFPTDLANLMVANFAMVAAGTFGLGMLLMLAGALFVRAERNKVAAGA